MGISPPKTEETGVSVGSTDSCVGVAGVGAVTTIVCIVA